MNSIHMAGSEIIIRSDFNRSDLNDAMYQIRNYRLQKNHAHLNEITFITIDVLRIYELFVSCFQCEKRRRCNISLPETVLSISCLIS